MNYARGFLVVLGISALIAGCGDGGKGTAAAAIDTAEKALALARRDAVEYVPSQVASIESSLASAKDNFAKGQFPQALTEAQGLMSKISGLAQAASARKQELTQQWTAMSTGLPKVIDSIRSRVDILSQAKQPPAGITKDAIANAKTSVDTISKQWTSATEAFASGNVAKASATAHDVKTQAAALMTSLNMQLPAALR